MKIAIPAETDPAEPRVAATPETVKKLKALGADVAVETGAGVKSGILDADYEAAGATIAPTAADAVSDADVVLKVRRPTAAELADYKQGALVIAIMDPYGNEAALADMAEAGVTALRDGTDAAHHARAGDGRAVLAGEPRRLSRRDRRVGRIRPRLADDDDGGRHRAGRARSS